MGENRDPCTIFFTIAMHKMIDLLENPKLDTFDLNKSQIWSLKCKKVVASEKGL